MEQLCQKLEMRCWQVFASPFQSKGHSFSHANILPLWLYKGWVYYKFWLSIYTHPGCERSADSTRVLSSTTASAVGALRWLTPLRICFLLPYISTVSLLSEKPKELRKLGGFFHISCNCRGGSTPRCSVGTPSTGSQLPWAGSRWCWGPLQSASEFMQTRVIWSSTLLRSRSSFLPPWEWSKITESQNSRGWKGPLWVI